MFCGVVPTFYNAITELATSETCICYHAVHSYMLNLHRVHSSIVGNAPPFLGRFDFLLASPITNNPCCSTTKFESNLGCFRLFLSSLQLMSASAQMIALNSSSKVSVSYNARTRPTMPAPFAIYSLALL